MSQPSSIPFGIAHCWPVLRRTGGSSSARRTLPGRILLRRPVQSLAAFVDAVVLERGISVFDYALNPLGDRFTYLSAMWSENVQAVPDLRVVEFLSPVLIPVRVVDPVWTQLHLKAGATLAFANAIQPDRAEELGRELRTTSWGQWGELRPVRHDYAEPPARVPSHSANRQPRRTLRRMAVGCDDTARARTGISEH